MNPSTETHPIGSRSRIRSLILILLATLVAPVRADEYPPHREVLPLPEPSGPPIEQREARKTPASWTIENARTRLTVARRESGGQVRFVLESMVDRKTGMALDTSRNPIWQVLIGGKGRQLPGLFFPSHEALVEGSLLVDPDQAAWGDLDVQTITLRWKNLLLPGGQRLDIVASVRLREGDGRAEWTIRANLSGGDLFLASVAFPYLSLPGIGETPSDDILLHPSFGGSLIHAPQSQGETRPEFDHRGHTRSTYEYPGEVMSQFMTLYDADLGLYLAAEDGASNLKGLAYSVTREGLRLWFRHHNTAPIGTTVELIRADLRNFDLADLGYTVVTDFHHGDWMDAADLYRDWAERSSVAFLAHGPLPDRKDIGPRVKENCLRILYSFGFNQTGVDAEDFARLTEMLDFLRENEPDLSLGVGLLGVVNRREKQDIVSEAWYGSVGAPVLDGDLKADVPSLIDWLSCRHDVPVDHNRDIGSWSLDGPTEKELYFQEDARTRAIVRGWNGTLHRKPNDENHRSTCGGSSWMLDRRFDIRKATVLDSRGGDSRGAGIIAYILSGQGSVAKACFAALHSPECAQHHDHPVGGATGGTNASRDTLDVSETSIPG